VINVNRRVVKTYCSVFFELSCFCYVVALGKILQMHSSFTASLLKLQLHVLKLYQLPMIMKNKFYSNVNQYVIELYHYCRHCSCCWYLIGLLISTGTYN